MTSLMAKYNVPGAQLAVAYQGRLVLNHGYGTASQGVTTQPETYSALLIFRNRLPPPPS